MPDHLSKRVTKLEEKVGHLERLNAPRQQTKAGPSPEQDAEQENYTTPGQTALPSTSNAGPSLRNSKQTDKPWYKTFQGWRARLELPKIVLEVIAIPFAVGYAIVTYCQWQDLRREQRAWVKAELAVPPNVTPNYSVRVAIVNIGKSPALQPIADVAVEVVTSTGPPSFQLVPYHNRIVNGILFPTDKSPAVVGPTPNNTDGSNRSLTNTEIAELASGNSYIAVFGVIRYGDQFGKHWTRFCSWQAYPGTPTANQNFSANDCARYNQTGDNDPPT